MTIIYVDADACPVRNEVQKVAARFELKTVMVSDGGIRPSNDPLVQMVMVASGADAADDWIETQVQANDVVVTNDILLAARCLEKHALALGPTGKEFTRENIGMKIGMRELNRHLRETGMGGSFNRPFDASDRSRFLQTLDLLLLKAISQAARPDG